VATANFGVGVMVASSEIIVLDHSAGTQTQNLYDLTAADRGTILLTMTFVQRQRFKP